MRPDPHRLFGPEEPDSADLRGTLLLDALYDAEVHILRPQNETFFQMTERLNLLALRRIRELEGEGHRCYEIPAGGATPLGSIGYILGYQELMEQMEALGKAPDYLFLATGSGGTLAGLAAGRALRGDRLDITGFLVAPKEPGDSLGNVVSIAKAALKLIGQDQVPIIWEGLRISSDFCGPGYGIPNPEANRVIRRQGGRASSGFGLHRKGFLRDASIPAGGQSPQGKHRSVSAHRRDRRSLCREAGHWRPTSLSWAA